MDSQPGACGGMWGSVLQEWDQLVAVPAVLAMLAMLAMLAVLAMPAVLAMLALPPVLTGFAM